jgi:hypothetical protein
MAGSARTSLHGRKVGLSNEGQLLVSPEGISEAGVPYAPYVLAAAGTALTASSTETALASYTIPARTLAAGNVIRVRYQGIATATNGADTLAIKLYVGGLSGTAVISAAAIDVANNDTFAGWADIVVRTVGAAGTFVACGWYKTTGAEGTATMKDDITASTAIDTTATQAITLSGTFSSTNAGNSCRCDVFIVSIE